MPKNLRNIMTLSALLVAMACGGDDVTGPGNTQATLQLVNTSENTVLFARTRPCGTTSWGTDFLGAEVLSTGEAIEAEFTPGCYDVRLTPAEIGSDYVYFLALNLVQGQTKTLTVSEFPAEQ